MKPLQRPIADARGMRGRIEAAFGSTLPAYPLEPAPQPWLERSLDADYALLFIDSMPLRIRENDLMCSRSLHLVLGISPDGSKDILDVHIERPGSRDFWPAAIRRLKARGVKRIAVAVAEEHAALAQDFRSLFPATVLVSNVKLAFRRSLEHLPLSQRAPAAKEIAGFLTGPGADFFDLACVRAHPGLTATWQSLWKDAAGLFRFSAPVRKLICATTAAESVAEKLRRRGLSKRANFASRDAALQELVLVLRDAKGAWRVAANLWQEVRAHLAPA